MSELMLPENSLRDLRMAVAQLALGETVTLADDDGKPLALVVSLQAEAPRPEVDAEKRRQEAEAWMRRWDALAQKIDKAWQGEQGAVETLLEMRR